MKSVACVALVMLGCVAADRPEFSLQGRRAHIRLAAGNDAVDVRLGRVFEATAAGTPVPGKSLPNLASLNPSSVTNGEWWQLDHQSSCVGA